MKLHLPQKLSYAVLCAILLAPGTAVHAGSEPDTTHGRVIEGDSGTIILDKGDDIDSIQTTGADIEVVSNPIKLANKSSMRGGTLTLSFSASQAAQNATHHYWGGSGTETAFTGAILLLTHVKVVLNQIEPADAQPCIGGNTFLRSGLTLFNIANTYGSAWSCTSTLEVNAPMLEKYFTNYRFGNDYYYFIGPVYPRPFPVYPDYGTTYAEADAQEEWTEVVIIPTYPQRGNITVVADRELNYYGKHLRAATDNGQAGMELAGLATGLLAPQLEANRASSPDLAKVMDSLDLCVTYQLNEFADRLTAALAGASVTTLAQAAQGDLDRQLRAIRNRIAAINYDGASSDHPLRNIWCNAESDYRRLSADGTRAGYKMDSWGGSFGLDYNVGKDLVAGISATAMFGDLKADGPETSAKGDIDTTYLNLFARYARNTWAHTLLVTLGHSDMSLDRTVDTLTGTPYTTRGKTSGHSFGLLYELSDTIKLDSEGKSNIQPLVNLAYRHTAVDGYAESGSDAALLVDGNTMDTVTLGLGARLQSRVGGSVINRESTLELRALLKMDRGDLAGRNTVALSALPWDKAIVRGAKGSPAGLELGAGLNIPCGVENGAVFIDATFETRHREPNFNGTVGFRISF